MRIHQLLAILLLGLAVAGAVHGAEPVAVVELFTSEGCSSCPPADRLLAQLAAESREDERPVFFLAYHVDYWDRLGWPDRFAEARFSQRQRRYAAALGERRVYTPQAVVNGRWSMVGSDEPELRAAVERALELAGTVAVSVSADQGPDDGRLVVQVAGEGAASRVVANVALVESGLETEVRRGENAGRTLRHSHVVRAFASAPLEDGSVALELQVPDGGVPGKMLLVAFLQDPQSMRILGAASTGLP